MEKNLRVVVNRSWFEGNTTYTYHLGEMTNGLVSGTPCGARKRSRSQGWSEATEKTLGELATMRTRGERKACKRCQAMAKKLLEAA